MSRRIRRETAPEAVYGTKFAPVYDRMFDDLNTSRALDTLLLMARQHGGRVLELGAGTGRLTIGLAKGGCEVVGVDISEEMLTILRAKHSGRNLKTIRGDMANLNTLRLGEFDLVLLAFNGIFHLLTEQRQRSCVLGAAQLLQTGGLLIIETSRKEGVLPARRYDLRLNVRKPDHFTVVLRLRDGKATQVRGWHVEIAQGSVRIMNYRQRYLSLSCLDRFAADAGLILRHRWRDWTRCRWTDNAPWAVTIYQKR